MNNSITIKALLWVVFLTFTPCLAVGRGIPITPDANGSFEYADDFYTPRFFQHAFETNIPNTAWECVLGDILYRGSTLHITYRFYGDSVIEQAELQVEQTANPKLGGRNQLFLSSNGQNWTLVASNEKQKAGEDGWQREPLVVSPTDTAKFTGAADLWVRIVLDNTSGKKTDDISNRVSSIQLKLKLGAKTEPTKLPCSEKDKWASLSRKNGWKIITLDGDDPIDKRPPHYYEDSDGWLQVAGDNPYLVPNEAEGFPIRKTTSMVATRFPLSMAAFVKTKRAKGTLMAKITVRSDPKSSQKMNVLWDGERLASFDTRSEQEAEKTFFVEIPGPQRKGVHQLRVVADYPDPVFIRKIALVGAGSPEWVEKPSLPKNGSLKLLSAYYMPDPKPPAGSQTVEGRHESRPVGYIFRPLQKLYQEHADFGGLRVLVQNKSRVVARIGNTLYLNGKPIEDSYIHFAKDKWDARGVLWYRVRPRTLQPGQCAELYIRFRRRPEGDHASVTIPLENGKSLTAKVPYVDPGVIVDYVTTGQSPDTLYVYARRTADTEVGKIRSLVLDGKKLRDVKIYGADFPGNVALAVAKLNKPLKLGSRHVVGIVTDTKKAIHAQFKVLRFFYPLSSFEVPPSLLKQYHMNISMWSQRSLEQCEKYDIFTTRKWGAGFFNSHKRVAYVIPYDEPDAHDPKAYMQFGSIGMGLGARGRWYARTGWQTLVDRFGAPGIASWSMINGTNRPLNWSVYGQWADVMGTDPYTIMGYDADHTFVRESITLARQVSAPHRLYITAEAFGFRAGVGTPDWQKRGPSPEEYRQNVIQSIGCGMKGLTSWNYLKHLAGWQMDHPVAKAVEKEITSLNKLIEHIEDKLLICTPIDLVSNDAGTVITGTAREKKWLKERLWTSSLLCGPDTIIIAAANHIPATLPGMPKIEPARNVTITVKLPEFLPVVEAFEVTEDGLTPIDCNLVDGKAILKPASIESGRVFLLRRK